MNEKPGTLIELLDLAARTYGARTALSIRQDLRTACWSFDDLRGKASAFAGNFRHEIKLKEQDRVVICCAGSPTTVASYFGAMQAGLIVVPMDIGSSPDFLAAVVRKTEAALFLRSRTAPRVEGVTCVDIETLDLSGARTFEGRPPLPHDIAEIVFTSGTTGTPKGTILSHSNIVANVFSASRIVPAGMPLRLLSVLPLSHMLEQTVGLYLPILTGGSVHYPPGLKAPVLVRELRRRKATGMVVVPRLLEMMLKSLQQVARQQGRLQSWDRNRWLAQRLPIDWRRRLFRRLHEQLGGELSFFLCGGAPLAPGIAREWQATGIRVIEGYGATECAPVIASNTYARRNAGTIGKPVAGVEVKLSNEGELLARGANVSRGYWRDTGQTAAAFTPQGWFHTGDLAEIDQQGIIRITGRLTDRIVLSSGQKVFPVDVEAQLKKQKGVVDCVVLALPDATGEDRIHASIRTEPGMDADQAAAAAVRIANTRLGSHQRLAGYSIWAGNDFPRTALGKVKRSQVRAGLLAQMQKGTPPVDARQVNSSKTTRDQLDELLRQVCKNNDLQIMDDSDLVHDLGLDSLGLVELATAIEEQAGITVDEEELVQIATVAQLAAMMETGANAKQPAQARWPTGKWATAARGVLQSILLFPVHRLIAHPFVVEGAEHLAGVEMPVLFIANHASHADTVAIMRAMPPAVLRRTAIAAAADYFYRYAITGSVASLALNAFPFSRSGNVRASFEHCGELMDDGWSVLIYPEGSRSADGRLLPFKAGIGVLARDLHVPVVPLAVEGGAAILPKGTFWPRRGPAKVRFGDKIIVEAGADAQALTRRLEDSVARLMNAPAGGEELHDP